uniref:Guanine nucleotide-binding protein G(s) subunit alpha n=1 Tax=Strigamia maritima TaxID=126957 RepID=T1J0Q7_STRMM
MFLFSCCSGIDRAAQKDKDLNMEIKKWHKEFSSAIKILLLGAGESGKTTILKQMKILHINGFSDSERMDKATDMRRNILQALLELISIMPKLQPPAILTNPENQKGIDFLSTLDFESISEFSEEFYDYVSSLWSDSGIKDCLNRSHEYPLIDCAKYFLQKIDTIRKPDFIPSDQDILQSRKRTPDINKVEFSMKIPKQYGGGMQLFWMFDVGGQRGERKKWIQVFEGISAILFLTSCSSFDTHLREDIETNTLKESLELFDQVWNSRFLQDSGIILFLNKQDVLREKVTSGISIGPYFDDYEHYHLRDDEFSDDEYMKTRCFIRDKFLGIATKKPENRSSVWSMTEGSKSKNRTCYWHFTIATDTTNVKRVFEDVHSMIVLGNLTDIGLNLA